MPNRLWYAWFFPVLDYLNTVCLIDLFFQLRSQELSRKKTCILKFYPAELKESSFRGDRSICDVGHGSHPSDRSSDCYGLLRACNLIESTTPCSSSSHTFMWRYRDAVSSYFRSVQHGLLLPCSHRPTWFHAGYAVASKKLLEPSGLCRCCDASLCLWLKAENASSCLCAF